MRIALDFDDVIVDTCALKSKIAKELYGIDISPELFKGDRVTDLLSVHQYQYLRRGVAGWQFGLEVQPICGAVEHIKKLQRRGHIICVVTLRSGKLLEVAEEWAVGHGLSLSFRGVGYRKSKASALRGCDIFMDDNPRNLIDAKNIVPHRFLFLRENDLPMDVPEDIIRVPCWYTFYCHVRDIALMQR